MKITIKEVADKAGVSPITVSRAFSGTHPVAETTRQRIYQVAEELGYVPDLLARAMVQKQTPIIGVTVLELANPFFAPIIDAIQAESRKRNFMVIVSQSERQESLEHDSLNQYRQMRVIGILVTPVAEDLAYLDRLRKRGTNIVVVAREWEDGDFVTVDDFSGGKIVGEHFSKLGHRKIGCIALDEPKNTALQSRINGFKQALEEGDSALGEGCILLTKTLRTDQGIRAADTFMEMPEKPSAVFVTADRLAIGFVHRLREHGVRIPDDVAVVGYDDIRYSEFLEVPLTTVALPKYDIGQRATQILFERIQAGETETTKQQIHLKPELVIRKSCGAIPGPR